MLTAAAVVELDDLTVEDLGAYLPRTAAGHRTGMWDPVLERMRAQPHAPGPATLRRVLTTPLMVFLARTVYSDTPGHDPTELLDTHRFPTAQAVQDHLLAAFIPAVYQADHPGTRRRWPTDRAHRYLTYLASHLHKAGTRDLAWWQLRDTIPRSHRTLIFAVVDGLVTGPASRLVFGLMYGLEAGVWVAAGLAVTLASGLTVALTVGLTKGLRGQRLRGTPRFLSSRFTIAPGTGLVVGLMVGLTDGRPIVIVLMFMFVFVAGIAAGLIGLRGAGPQPTRTRLQIRGRTRFIASRFVGGFAAGLSFVLVSGLVFVLVAGLAFGLEAPVNAADVVSVAESLAWDRRNTIRKMLATGLAVGLPGGLPDGLADGLLLAVVVGFVGVRATNAWTYWLVLVRGWLPLTGRLPWRVQAFLTDAYQRGVLRQTGAVYQFRHARLQDHLTAEPPAEVRSPVHGASLGQTAPHTNNRLR